MTGGIFQLVVYGIEDLILTHKPDITFFKCIYKRYTNFSIESIKQNFNELPDFGKRVSCIISKSGDLMYKVYVELTLPRVLQDSTNTYAYAWTKNIGFTIIKNVDIEIGGQVIDKHYNDWMYIWNELTMDISLKDGFNYMTGNISQNTDFSKHISSTTNVAIDLYTCYIPLYFWFCKNPNLALPLIALKYQEVKINIEFNSLENCLLKCNIDFSNELTKFNEQISGVSIMSTLPKLKAQIYVDYIFLDKTEKTMFESKIHEYYIEQLQYNEDIEFLGDYISEPLIFNHPVKELVWVLLSTDNENIKDFFNYTTNNIKYSITGNKNNSNITTPTFTISSSNGKNPVKDAKLILNGIDRFAKQYGSYFNLIQPYQYHTKTPPTGVNLYSFSLYPEDIQPSGTCNFSKMEDSLLEININSFYKINSLGNEFITSGTGYVKIYATNYNIFRITNGMGGILFSN